MSTITWIGRIAAMLEKQAVDVSKITPAPKKLKPDASKNITQSVGGELLRNRPAADYTRLQNQKRQDVGKGPIPNWQNSSLASKIQRHNFTRSNHGDQLAVYDAEYNARLFKNKVEDLIRNQQGNQANDVDTLYSKGLQAALPAMNLYGQTLGGAWGHAPQAAMNRGLVGATRPGAGLANATSGYLESLGHSFSRPDPSIMKVPSTAEQEQSIPVAQQLGGALGRMAGGGASPNAATRNVIQNKTKGAR